MDAVYENIWRKIKPTENPYSFFGVTVAIESIWQVLTGSPVPSPFHPIRLWWYLRPHHREKEHNKLGSWKREEFSGSPEFSASKIGRNYGTLVLRTKSGWKLCILRNVFVWTEMHIQPLSICVIVSYLKYYFVTEFTYKTLENFGLFEAGHTHAHRLDFW